MTQLLVVVLLSILAFWKPNPVIFMITGACAIFTGFAWFDAYGTHTGLAISLMLIAYCFVCFAFAYRYIFWSEE